jgi:hypothetical protein
MTSLFRLPTFGLVGAASILVTLGGCASIQHDDGAPAADATPDDVACASLDQGPVVCRLVGRDSIVEVLAGNDGRRYTLKDAGGALIASNLDATGLAQIRPDLDPRRLQADEPAMGPIMMVDTER